MVYYFSLGKPFFIYLLQFNFLFNFIPPQSTNIFTILLIIEKLINVQIALTKIGVIQRTDLLLFEQSTGCCGKFVSF